MDVRETGSARVRDRARDVAGDGERGVDAGRGRAGGDGDGGGRLDRRLVVVELRDVGAGVVVAELDEVAARGQAAEVVAAVGGGLRVGHLVAVVVVVHRSVGVHVDVRETGSARVRDRARDVAGDGERGVDREGGRTGGHGDGGSHVDRRLVVVELRDVGAGVIVAELDQVAARGQAAEVVAAVGGGLRVGHLVAAIVVVHRSVGVDVDVRETGGNRVPDRARDVAGDGERGVDAGRGRTGGHGDGGGRFDRRLVVVELREVVAGFVVGEQEEIAARGQAAEVVAAVGAGRRPSCQVPQVVVGQGSVGVDLHGGEADAARFRDRARDVAGGGERGVDAGRGRTIGHGDGGGRFDRRLVVVELRDVVADLVVGEVDAVAARGQAADVVAAVGARARRSGQDPVIVVVHRSVDVGLHAGETDAAGFRDPPRDVAGCGVARGALRDGPIDDAGGAAGLCRRRRDAEEQRHDQDARADRQQGERAWHATPMARNENRRKTSGLLTKHGFTPSGFAPGPLTAPLPPHEVLLI